jgi:hypothetical protein
VEKAKTQETAHLVQELKQGMSSRARFAAEICDFERSVERMCARKSYKSGGILRDVPAHTQRYLHLNPSA